MATDLEPKATDATRKSLSESPQAKIPKLKFPSGMAGWLVGWAAWVGWLAASCWLAERKMDERTSDTLELRRARRITWHTRTMHESQALCDMPCYICERWPLPPLAVVTWVDDLGQVAPPPPWVTLHAPPAPLWIWCDRLERHWGEAGLAYALACAFADGRERERQRDVRERMAAVGGS